MIIYIVHNKSMSMIICIMLIINQIMTLIIDNVIILLQYSML
jgi:hypothetical protein